MNKISNDVAAFPSERRNGDDTGRRVARGERGMTGNVQQTETRVTGPPTGGRTRGGRAPLNSGATT